MTLNAAESSKKRKVGVIFSYLYTIGQIIVNLLYVPILLKGIGTSEYGLYQLIGSVIAYMTLMNSTFSGGVTRFYSKYHSEGNTEKMETTLALSRFIYRIVSIVSLIVGAIAIVAVRLIYSKTFSEFQLMESSIMVAVLVVNLIVTMNNTINVAVINANEMFSFLKGTQLATVIIQPVIIVVAIHFYPFALIVSCVQLIMNIICATIQRVYARKTLGAKVILHEFDKPLLRSLLIFSSGVVMVLIADQVFWRTNQLILGYMYGTTVVAVYGVASQIYSACVPIGTAVSSVFMPRLSELFHKNNDMDSISKLFTRVGRISLYPLLLVLFGFAIFGQSFIILWAGDEFGDAYWIALIVLIPYTVDIMQNLGLTIMQVMDRYYFRGKMYLIIAIINIIAVIIVAPTYGAIGAAICTALLTFIGNGIVMNIYYAKVIKLNIYGFWKDTSRVILPLVLYATIFKYIIISSGLKFNEWGSLVMGIVIFSVFYLIIAVFFTMNDFEKGILIGNRIPKS